MNEIARREESNQVATLLALAVEKGLGVEGLEKLVALQERVMDRQAAGEFAQAMADFQKHCPPIARTSTAKIVTGGGSNYSYSYAELDEIARTVNPILSELGFSYTWDSTMTDNLLTCVCTLRHASGHKVSSSFTAPLDQTARMNGPQKAKAALTYSQRCSLISVLGLTTCDPDTDAVEPTLSGTITEAQQADLRALLEEVGAQEERFCKWLGATSVSAIQSRDYSRAIQALEGRRR